MKKMPVFEILECGLSREKNGIYICMSKCGRNVLKTRRYDLLIFLFFYLIKTAANFMRTESVKCPARARYSPSREPGTCILWHSIYLQVIKVYCSINRVSYVHSSRTTDESLHCFVLPFQLILFSRIETARHLVRSDFLQRSTQTLKYVDEFPK